MDTIIDRVTRVLKLDSSVFREIAADEGALGPAVGISALAFAISGLTSDGNILSGVLLGAVFGGIGLFVWTGVVFLVGKMFGGTAEYIDLVRPFGFAAAPLVLGIFPVLGLVGLAYSLVIQIRAVREVNQVGDGSAVATVLIPFGVLFVIALIFAIIVGAAMVALLGGL